MAIYHYPVVNIVGATGPTGPAPTNNSITVTSASYGIAYSDWFVGVNHSGLVTLTLPTGIPSFELYIKDQSGLASTNVITINASGGNTIDGVSTIYINTNHGHYHLIYQNEWSIV